MENTILYLAAVTLSLAALVVVPFVPLAYSVVKKRNWPLILLTAWVLGTTLQAVIGFFWSHLVGSSPYGELIVLFTVWGGAFFYNRWYRKKTLHQNYFTVDEISSAYLPVAAILLLTYLVRVVHPLDVAYLGQSDAYTHLDYLHYLVDHGALANPAYPTGYHWIMALPTLVFSIDPYWVARFGGAFWGVGLVLGIFVMTERMFNRQAAYYACFTAACFPPMTLLMKTGVGVFANQFGLFLLPAIFLWYFMLLENSNGRFGSAFMLAMAMTGMAAAVPMMLLHILLIIAAHRFFDLSRISMRWLTKTTTIGLITIIPVLVVLFHVFSIGNSQRMGTVSALTDYGTSSQYSESKQPASRPEATALDRGSNVNRILRQLRSSPYYSMAIDYFSVKRVGFGNWRFNSLGVLLSFIFLGFTIYGLIAGRSQFLILGLWGGVTTVQAATGFLQFSSYQREGWSLLVATCCLSGVMAAWLLKNVTFSAAGRIGTGIVAATVVVWALLRPPHHGSLRSDAEDELVRSIRFLSRSLSHNIEFCERSDEKICQVIHPLLPDIPVILVTRKFAGWSNQGKITTNVMQQNSEMQGKVVARPIPANLFQTDRQYVVFIDKWKKLTLNHDFSAFAMVTPALVQATLKRQKNLLRTNQQLLETINHLSSDEWSVTTTNLSANLTAFTIIPESSH